MKSVFQENKRKIIVLLLLLAIVGLFVYMYLDWYAKNTDPSLGGETIENTKAASAEKEIPNPGANNPKDILIKDLPKAPSITESETELTDKANGEGADAALETIEDVMYQNQLRLEEDADAELLSLTMWVLTQTDLKADPDKEAITVKELYTGDEVKVYRMEEDWYFLSAEDRKGYVPVKMLGSLDEWKAIEKSGSTAAQKNTPEKNQSEKNPIGSSLAENGASEKGTIEKGANEMETSENSKEIQAPLSPTGKPEIANSNPELFLEEIGELQAEQEGGKLSSQPLSEEELIQIYKEHGINYEEIQLH